MRLRLSPKIGRWIIGAFTIILLAGFVILDHIAPAGRKLATVKGIDAVTYFDIAHSVLFDHDFNLNNEFERMKPEEDIWTARQPETGLPGSVWAVGYSLLEIPLLALGTRVDALAGNPADGFSQWALFFYCTGTLLMVGCGMAALFTFLQSIGEYWNITPEDHQSAYALFVTLVIFFATNVGYYAFSRMSHT